MFDTGELRKKVERALLIGIETPDTTKSDTQTLLNELKELVSNLDIEPAESMLVTVKKPNPRLLMGKGKAQEIFKHIKDEGYDCIVFDNELSPAQQRNWERETGVCVIDREEVILDIFAERAQTKAAVLQVELARLEYSLPRLRRAWTHLSRQRGGSAMQRGEGETQLEMDQRMVRKQISRVKEQLTTVIKQREVQRKQRMRVPMPTAAIVGYTNAGKSSLLNRLTDAGVLAADKLFATLDPTTRRTELPDGQTLLLTDTVGFVRRLPHGLVEAFKATLEEAVVSDFLIHVIDVSNPHYERHMQTTRRVLGELGADKKKILTVYNKIDLIKDPMELRLIEAADPKATLISTHTGDGIERLKERMDEMLQDRVMVMELLIPHDRYDLVSKLHRAGAVAIEKPQDDGVYIQGAIPRRMMASLVPFALKETPLETALAENFENTSASL